MLFAAFSLLLLASSVSGGHLIPRFRINLDVEPRHRWDHVIAAYKGFLPAVIEESKKYIPERLQPFVWHVTENFDHYFPTEIKEELEGISNSSGLPLGEIVALNMLYDLTAFDRKHVFGLGCTSIVAQNSRGQIFHGRNLDYEMTELLRNISIYVDFVKNGSLQYAGLTFPLYNGLLTGENNGYTVSLNARFDGPYIETILMELYLKFKLPVSIFIRKTLETVRSYGDAVQLFSNTHLFSPSYIVLAGTKKNEGAIIARNRWSATNIHTLDDNQWYLVETNYDNWKEQGDDRRITAIKMLKKTGRENLEIASMARVMATEPIANNLTIFTALMSAQYPHWLYHYSYVWDQFILLRDVPNYPHIPVT